MRGPLIWWLCGRRLHWLFQFFPLEGSVWSADAYLDDEVGRSDKGSDGRFACQVDRQARGGLGPRLPLLC